MSKGKLNYPEDFVEPSATIESAENEIHRRILQIVQDCCKKVRVALPSHLFNGHMRENNLGGWNLFMDRHAPIESPMSPLVNLLRSLTKRRSVFHYDLINSNERFLSNHCLGTSNALRCLLDSIRTTKFIDALILQLKEIGDKEFEIVDAGCGPIPIFGIISALMSKNAKITCIECDRVSCQMAQTLIEKLELGDKINIIRTDATKYQHHKPVDLLVSETLAPGLTDELYAQIFDNFKPQMNQEGGKTIPESVTVGINLVNKLEVHNPYYAQFGGGQVGPKIKINPVGTLDNQHNLSTIEAYFDFDDFSDGPYYVFISSSIIVDGKNGIILEGLESNATAPTKIKIKNNRSRINPDIQICPRTRRKYRGIKIKYTPGTMKEDIKPEFIAK